MNKQLLCIVLVALVGAALATRAHVERSAPVPLADGWQALAQRATADDLLEVRRVHVALWGNYEELDELFWRVSNPKYVY